MGGMAYPGSGMSLPRPYPASSGGNLPLNRGMHDSADRIAAMYGTLRSPHRRPHSTVGGSPGECIGRDGGLCEQQVQRPATPNTAAQISMQKDLHASQLSPCGQERHQSEETEVLKQSVQEQLQQLVRELEAGDDQVPEQQQTGNNIPQYEQFSIPHGSPIHTSGTQKHPSATEIYSPQTLPHSSSTPMYSSNPALHISCIPMQPSSTQTHSDSTLLNSGYQGTPKTKNLREKNEDTTRLRKNTSLAREKQLGNNANLKNGKENTSNCEMAASAVKNTLPSSTTSTSNIPMFNNDTSACDQKNHAVSVNRIPSDKVNFRQEGATSPPNSDGDGDGFKHTLNSQDQRLRSSYKVIRSADRSALDAYRRSRGRSDMHEYQRGKSEDLCHALNSLSRESSLCKGGPVRAVFNSQNLPNVNTKKPDCDTSLTVTSGTAKNKKQNQVMESSSHNNNNNNNNIDNNNCNNNKSKSINNKSVNGTVLKKTNLATSHIDLTANTIPRVSNGSTNNDKNNNSGIITSRSTSGIPVKSNSRSSISTRSSYSGNSNSSTSTKGYSDVLQPKMYQKSKSRELTTTIEAASEKFSQLNSGTLKRISPFEAYRRTKSRELPIDAANKESLHARLKSPPPAPDRAKSPFEKAKTNIEKKCEYTKSPLPERATSQKCEGSAGVICASKTPDSNQLTDVAKEKKAEKTKIKSVVQEENREPKQSKYEHKSVESEVDTEKMQGKERGWEKDKEKEKAKEKDGEKERGKVKKTSSCEPEKPKSMYKLLASRFNRSGSNVADNNRSATDKRSEEDDANEKEDRFRLKRPSRFLKHKTEKSSSKSSVCDGDGVQDDSERPERKPSKKLTDALNKFLGRKDTKGYDPRSSVNSMSQPAMPTISTDDEQPKKPPRVKPKKFSKSQENLCLSRVEEGGETGARSPTIERAQSVVPDSCPNNLQPSYTLESVTKSICDHLSQLESDITSRIGNMGKHESGVRPTGGTQVVSAVSSMSPITTYGLSPALAHRRNSRPTNLDLARGNNANHQPAKPLASQAAAATNTATNHIPNTEGERVKYAQIKRLDGAGDVDPSEDGSRAPTESGESTTTGFEDIRGLSENEDESVMDRITRKSYYSKFQNKKKPQLRRANTKEDMDQQLAAAKARLMKEDAERAVRESLSPLRYTSPIVSPRASITSPPSWEVPRRHSRKSLPPEDPNNFLLGGRRGTSLQPDDLLGIRRFTSVQPEEMHNIHRIPSVPVENCPYTQRAPSMPLDDYSSSCRMKSIPPEDHTYKHRAPSIQSDDFSSKCHLKSIPCNDSKTSSLSPVTDNELGDEQVQDAVAVAAAAGALAGEAAAVVAGADSTNEGGSRKSREPSVNRVLRPEHANRSTPTQDDTRSLAREELSRRLTHLTRISGTSGLSGWNRGGLAGGSNTGNMSEKRSYRRTNTTGHLGEQLSGSTSPSINPGLGERPVYRRTNTMDLPPADARARPGSEYRRQLQDPARRYSAARTLVEGEVLTTPSTRLPSSHLTSPSLSSSSSYHRGYSTMDPPRYTSTLSSNISPLPRRTSFYRY